MHINDRGYGFLPWGWHKMWRLLPRCSIVDTGLENVTPPGRVLCRLVPIIYGHEDGERAAHSYNHHDAFAQRRMEYGAYLDMINMAMMTHFGIALAPWSTTTSSVDFARPVPCLYQN